MKTIIAAIVTFFLFFILSCNYDYGEYGKGKSKSSSGQTMLKS